MKFLEKYKNRPNNLFGLFYWNFLFGYLPFSILFGILSLFEIVPIRLNGEPTYGIKAFLFVVLFSPLVVLGFSVVVWVYFVIGNFILKQIRKS